MIAARAPVRAALLPLFFVSLSAVGYEIALTRYFAVAKWSEYGYWVISIVMVGFALSGVIMALFRDAFVRNAAWLMAALPALLILAAAIGFHLTTTNPFNPLQLQNPATWIPQLWNIAGYYACLLPFFFLTGIFVSLSFVLNAREIGRVYGYDLTGAGFGALLALGLMFVVHPFVLVPCLLAPLAVAALWTRGRWGWTGAAAALAALLCGEALLLLDNEAAFNDFKAIYAPLHTPDSRVTAEVRSPRGYYLLLDDFTERVDTDVSNNAGMLGFSGPPQTFGLYRDGNRIASLPKPGPVDAGYAGAALDSLPYQLIPHARVMLAGISGGFRIAEVLALGATHVDALEPEPVLREAARNGLGPSPSFSDEPRMRLLGVSPLVAAAEDGPYDVVDLSADFLELGGNQCVGAFRRGDRPLSPGPDARRDRLDPRLDPRFPRLRAADAGHGASRAHRSGDRRSGLPCRRVPLGLERPHPAVQPCVGCRSHRSREDVLRRSFVRRVVLSRHGCRSGAAGYL